MIKLIQVMAGVIFAILLTTLTGWLIYTELKGNHTIPSTSNRMSNTTINDTTILKIISRVNDDHCGMTDIDNRIFNGNKTQLYEFPWMALLAYNRGSKVEFMCGGSLITNRHVLTAAHCITGTSNLTFVRLGEYNISSETDCDVSSIGEKYCSPKVQDIKIKKLIPHPGFIIKLYPDDIGIIVLEKPVDLTLDNIKTICLPLMEELQNINLNVVTITGWGNTEIGTRSDVLLKANLPVVAYDRCRDIYRSTNITNKQICIGGIINSNSCNGDSGGPLQMFATTGSDIRYYQFGVISLGPAVCGITGQPGVHTKIFNYLDWINMTVQRN